MICLSPPSILTIDPFINLFLEETIRCIKSIISSAFPILSTVSFFLINSLTSLGLEIVALYQLLFFAAIYHILILLLLQIFPGYLVVFL